MSVELTADYFIGITGRSKELAADYYDWIVEAVERGASGVPPDADLVIFNNGTRPDCPFDARVYVFARTLKEAEDVRDALGRALGFAEDALAGASSFGLLRAEITPFKLEDFREDLRKLNDRTICPLGSRADRAEQAYASRGRPSAVARRGEVRSSRSGSN